MTLEKLMNQYDTLRIFIEEATRLLKSSKTCKDERQKELDHYGAKLHYDWARGYIYALKDLKIISYNDECEISYELEKRFENA